MSEKTGSVDITYSPVTGELLSVPMSVDSWRERNTDDAWLYNPWTGRSRYPRDIGNDVYGIDLAYDDTHISVTKEQEYISSGGIFCLECGGEDLDTGEKELQGGGTMVVDVTCESCHTSWTEMYQLVSVCDKTNP